MATAVAEPIIRMANVRKSFAKTRAIDDISFEVARGEMFGVIGPDGSGKTTTLRLSCGLLRADQGQVRVVGEDPHAARRVATSSIGYLSQRFSLYGDLSIDENIAFFARVHGVRDFAAKRTRLLELTGLQPFRERLADRLSGGMKQKLALACTLVHEPPILVLDEPTTGVDPVSRREFWKLLAEFLAEGLTIVFATPYLDEAERCGRVVLLSQGRVLALDAPGALQAASQGVILEVVAARPAQRREAVTVLRRIFGPSKVQLFGDRLHVRVDDETASAAVHDALAAAGIAVTSTRRIVPTLEDVFIEKLAVGASLTSA
jgi:ABC-2 type transport system ATP-binding protein